MSVTKVAEWSLRVPEALAPAGSVALEELEAALRELRAVGVPGQAAVILANLPYGGQVEVIARFEYEDDEEAEEEPAGALPERKGQ